MTIIAITLITIGLADVLRRDDRFANLRYPCPAMIFAFIFPVLLAPLVGITIAQDWFVLYVGIATAIGWIITSHDATRQNQRHALPLGILLGGLAVLALFGTQSPTGGALGDWLNTRAMTGLQSLGAETLLLFIGAALLQLSTGNIIVRLVLAHIGALRPVGEPQPSDRLKGGRLLGPMERLFILGLGLAGQVTAAGLVIAAKGLIRFPELQAQARADADPVPDLSKPRSRRGPGIDELTEYFLIGSFVSWLVALATLALVWLGS